MVLHRLRETAVSAAGEGRVSGVPDEPGPGPVDPLLSLAGGFADCDVPGPGDPAAGRPELVPRVALGQGGVFTARQALDEGWTPRMVRRRLAARRWVRVAGRALARHQPRWTPLQLGIAATLTLPNVVVSHWTAAGLHGFPEITDPDEIGCEVIISGRRSAPPGIRLHRLSLGSADVVLGPADLLVTSPARTVIDCMAAGSRSAALDLWAWASTHGVANRPDLLAAIGARRRWTGTPQLTWVYDLTRGGAVSAAEVRCHEVLRSAGVNGWKANHPVHDAAGLIGVVDIAFVRQRVAIEIDGRRAHSSRAAFVNDRRRQNRLVQAGWTVLRFTWTDLDHPDRLVAQVRRMTDHRF